MASHWIDVQVAPGVEKPPGALLCGDRENDVAYVGSERGDKRMQNWARSLLPLAGEGADPRLLDIGPIVPRIGSQGEVEAMREGSARHYPPHPPPAGFL